MSLSKMAPLSWAYYAEEIGGGREDYYATAAERPGRFLGRGAEALGLAGVEVTAEAMERLFGHGCDPRDGRPLGRGFSPKDERVVAGFALTFSAPKTVSVLWALGDGAVSAAVLGAHGAAVEAAMAFLEAHAAFTRRGRGGLLQVDTEGLVAASFVHRTSRAADPQLHTHVLVANKVKALEDGRWLSLDARELFEHQKAAGMLYKTALRAELSARLGVSWSAVDDNGVAEVLGVPDELCAAWSARRQQVKALGNDLVAGREAELGRRLTSAEPAVCFQIAAYRTRAPKLDAETPTATLKARWREEAEGFGHPADGWLPGVLGHVRVVEGAPGAKALATVVARLEERSATWGRSDVVEECSRLVTGQDAGSVRRLVEALADEVLRDPEVVSLAAPLPAEAPESLRRRDQMAQFERHGAVRFTTTGTLRREASVLEEASGIRSETLAKVLHDLGRGASLAPRSVVVLDEAGMARTDDLARLVEAAKVAGAKLVLVGDPHQLGAVGPGGLFRTLVDDHGAHELETIRRFEHAWEAAASLRLRSRDPSILPAYLANDRIAEGSRNAMAEEALSAWRAAREEGMDLLVMTGDNASADELSRRCRAELVRAGLVEADGVRIASGVAGVGDEVVTLRNDRRLRPTEDDFVRNGARWRVVERGADGSLSVVPLAGEGMVRLPPEYVSEHVALAYSLTAHKAQGATSDRAVVLVDETMSAAQPYVAMSRGREENRALVVTSNHDPDEHARGVGLAGVELLVNVLRRDGSDRSAHEVLRSGLGRSEDRELVAGLRDVMTERIDERAGPDLRRQIAALEARDDLPAARGDLQAAEQKVLRAERQRVGAEERVALVGSPLRARLPGRLGIRARHELAVAGAGLTVARREEQQALRRLEASSQRVSTAEQQARELASLRARQDGRNAYLAEHPDEVAFVRTLNRLLRTGRGIAGPQAAPSGHAAARRAPSRAPRSGASEVMAPPAQGQEQDPSRRRQQRDGLSRRIDGAPNIRNVPSGTVPLEPPPGHEPRGPSLGM